MMLFLSPFLIVPFSKLYLIYLEISHNVYLIIEAKWWLDNEIIFIIFILNSSLLNLFKHHGDCVNSDHCALRLLRDSWDTALRAILVTSTRSPTVPLFSGGREAMMDSKALDMLHSHLRYDLSYLMIN